MTSCIIISELHSFEVQYCHGHFESSQAREGIYTDNCVVRVIASCSDSSVCCIVKVYSRRLQLGRTVPSELSGVAVLYRLSILCVCVCMYVCV